MLVDDAYLAEFSDTPDECSSHNNSGVRDPNDVLIGCGGSIGKSSDGALSSGGARSKGKRAVAGMSGMVLATSGVSRRLDFSKDRISKALSVVRSKKVDLNK